MRSSHDAQGPDGLAHRAPSDEENLVVDGGVAFSGATEDILQLPPACGRHRDAACGNSPRGFSWDLGREAWDAVTSA